MAANDPTTLMTVEEARRAIYVDFEGFTNKPPALMGWLYAEGRAASEDRLVLRQDIFDQILQQAARAVSIDGFSRYDQDARSIGQSINDLARRAKAQNRLIVSWSQAELRVVRNSELDPGLKSLFIERYRDGKATAVRWRRQRHPLVEMSFEYRGGANKLTRYLELIGYDLPSDYGLGQTTERIRRVTSGLQKRHTFDGLLESQKDAWSSLLIHNAVDCHGLREIILTATSQLQSNG